MKNKIEILCGIIVCIILIGCQSSNNSSKSRGGPTTSAGSYKIESSNFSGEGVLAYLYNESMGDQSITITLGSPGFQLKADGPKLINLPAGEQNYSGKYFGYDSYVGRSNPSLGKYDGTFIIKMNFTSGKGLLTATGSNPTRHKSSVSTSSLKMSNLSSGTFVNDSRIMSTINGVLYGVPWSLSGQFHGNSASGVTALYTIPYQSDSNYSQYGGYIGTKN